METKDIRIQEKNRYIYTKYFCEENIFKFIESFKDSEEMLSRFWVCFISSLDERVPKFFENSEGEVVIWDYHVIALYELKKNQFAVFDFDTVLPFGYDFENYFYYSFLISKDQFPETSKVVKILNNVRFRLVRGSVFLENFASDRSHMIDEKGNYPDYVVPPTYDPIVNKHGEKMNLNEWKGMKIITEEEKEENSEKRFGNVFEISKFTERICGFSNLEIIKRMKQKT